MSQWLSICKDRQTISKTLSHKQNSFVTAFLSASSESFKHVTYKRQINAMRRISQTH